MSKRDKILLVFCAFVVIGALIYKFRFESRHRYPSNSEQAKVVYKTNDKGIKVGYHKHYYPSGKLYSEFTTIRGKIEGDYKSYYESGKIKNEDHYKNDMLDGLCKRYREDGTYIDINHYKKGKMNGLTKWFYDTGELQSEIEYINYKRDGLVKIYYKEGQLREKSEWKKNQISGTLYQYYENGQLRCVSQWREGIQEGKTTDYYESGKIRANLSYKKDKLHGYNEWFYENGKTKKTDNYINGKQDGDFKYYDIDGYLTRYIEHKDGKREGKDIRYFPNSDIPRKEETYQDDRLNGPRLLYYRNGKIRWKQNFQDNQMSGVNQLFDINGNLTAEFIAENDQIQKVNHFSFDDDNYGQGLMTELDEESFLRDVFTLMLEVEDFQSIEKLAEKYRKESILQINGDYKSMTMFWGIKENLYKASNNSKIERLKILKKWKKQYPNSMTARTALIDMYNAIAWEHRGYGFTNSISKQGRKKYQYYLGLAYDEINEALKMNHRDPCFYLEYLVTMRDMGIEKKEIYAWVEEGAGIDLKFFPLYQQGAYVLLPRWKGQKGDSEDFAQWAYEKTKDAINHEMYARVILNLKKKLKNELFTRFDFSWDLTKKGMAELHAKYPKGTTILHNYAWLSCITGERELAKQLFSEIGKQWGPRAESVWKSKESYQKWANWASDETMNNWVTTEIHKNVRKLTPEAFERFIEDVPDINAQDTLGQTALHIAIISHRIKNAEILLKHGADVNIKDMNDYTPLLLTAQFYAPKIAGMLIARDADINAEDNISYGTTLHFAANNGFLEIVKLLIDQKGIKINEGSYSTQTALHRAAQKGYTDIVKMLVAKGADPKVQDRSSKTAADIAKENEHTKIFAYLKGRERY